MFGIWRTLLAIEVVAYHLIDVPVIGEYAVFAFFVLSGFLMTAIMQKTYGYSPAGFARYLQNRALRLYPSYWFAAGVTLVVIAAFGSAQVAAYNQHMIVPPTISAWLENLAMVFFGWYPKDHLPRLVPPAWALTVEIFYYILIGLGLSRTPQRALAWAVLSVGYIIVAAALGGGGERMYSALLAGSLPFAMGALTFHHRVALHRCLVVVRASDPRMWIVGRWLCCVAFASANAVTGWGWLISLGNYANIGISVMIVCTLFHAAPARRVGEIDRSIGDLSYPIYLLHWQGGAIASMMLFGELVRGRSLDGYAVGALGLLITIALGLICARLIDPVVEHWRTQVRTRALRVAGNT